MELEAIKDIAADEWPLYSNEPVRDSNIKSEKRTSLSDNMASLPQGPGSKLDSDTIDGINAYVSPTPNALLPLGTDGTYPVAAIPVLAITGNRASAETSGYSTYTASIPSDGTIPQISEGTQALTASITPTSATNILRVTVSGTIATSGDGTVTVALFRDSTADAVKAQFLYTAIASDSSYCTGFVYRVVAGSVSSTTFSVRVGDSAATTVSIGGYAGSANLGTTQSLLLEIEEITP